MNKFYYILANAMLMILIVTGFGAVAELFRQEQYGWWVVVMLLTAFVWALYDKLVIAEHEGK